MSKLPVILATAYGERMRNYHTALPAFVNASKDEKFRQLAQAEHDRLASLESSLGCPLAQRCYASAHQLAFLKVALSVPIPKTPEEENEMPAKLKSLAGMAKDAVADVENEAAAALNRLDKAKHNALAGVGKVNTVTAEIEQSTKDLNDFAAQTSNFPSGE